MSSLAEEPRHTVSEVTRRAIIDDLVLEDIQWWGDVEEIEFLSRMFDLRELPSFDGRFDHASSDIYQHRVNNSDWQDSWVFSDSRFNLLRGPDEVFLRFLSEMVHPVVRRDRNQATALLSLVNRHLAPDGWELAERLAMSGRPVYAARRLLPDGKLALSSARRVAEAVDADYINQQITRQETAIDRDPELAIGTAKEFVETVCKTILEERKSSVEKGLDFPKLVRAVLGELKLVPDIVPEHSKVAEPVRVLLQNLATVSNSLAEIRNRLGTGHGKSPGMTGLRARHARLAVHASTALAVFLFETHKEKLAP